MIIEITDNNTPMLASIRAISANVAFEVMSKSGNEIREKAKARMARNGHNWHQRRRKSARISKMEDGDRTYDISPSGKELIPYYDNSKSKILGRRTTRSGGNANPISMGSMITSNLIEEKGIVIIGGRNRRRQVVKREDGEVKGFELLPAISKNTQAIINKLDTGERNQYHGWGKSGKTGGADKESMENFKNSKYKGRGFMMDGYRDAVPYMKTQLTTAYEKTVGRAVNKVEIKLKPYTRKVL